MFGWLARLSGERTTPPGGRRPGRGHFQLALLSEIRMLLDYVAASPNVSLADVRVNEGTGGGDLAIGPLLKRVSEIEEKLKPAGEHHPHIPEAERAAPPELSGDDFAFLQLARDALVRKAWPASGLTIAFTALVSGQTRATESESRANWAGEAYAGLQSTARLHRLFRYGFLILAIFITLVAGWESAKVALGRSLLQSLDALHVKQADFNVARNKLEATLDPKPDAAGPPGGLVDAQDTNKVQIRLHAFALCNRPHAIAYYLERAQPHGTLPPDPGSMAKRQEAERNASRDRMALRDVSLPSVEPMRMYGSSAERDVCEQDGNLATNFGIVHFDLTQFRTNWPDMVGSVFSVAARIIHRTVCQLPICGSKPERLDPGQDDVEFIIAPMLMVWSNYVLPVIFGLLGSLIFVILDFYNKTRASTLHPRDTWLGPIRLVLGMVTGACIGLFFSASGLVTTGATANLASGLSLSASGLAFLAGFGVEGVFTMLEGLVRQAFPATPQGPRDR